MIGRKDAEIVSEDDSAGCLQYLKEGGRSMKYDLKSIMLRAWKNYRKYKELSFAECLHRAWITAKAESINAERIERAKAAAGVE